MRRSCSDNLPPPNYRIAKCRGQVTVLFALVVPLLFLILGLVLDLGWYYLNVSRMQNAADAAAVAGAQTIMDSEYFSGYKSVTLVGKYPGKGNNEYKVDNIDEFNAIEEGNNVAEEYITKNLSSKSHSSLTDSWTKAEIQIENLKLYEKNDNLYYVVRLKEGIRHFLLPGWFDDMAAPVTAVALLSKRAVIVDDVTIPDDTDTNDDTPDTTDTNGDTPDTPPVVESNPTLIFDTNGGYFSDHETRDSKTLKALEDIEDGEVLAIRSEKGTPTYSNNTKEFKGWSTEKNPSADSPIVYYYDGKQLVKSEIEALFGSNTTVTLYAVWVDKTTPTTPTTPTNPETPAITEETIKPHNNRTLWEQMQYLIAKNVYNDYWYAATNKYGKNPNYSQFQYSGTYTNSTAYYAETATPTNKGIKFNDTERCYIDFQQTSIFYGFPTNYGKNRRAHALFNVDAAYEVRSSHKNKDDDPIYFRIEAEPYASETSPIRQIVININESNLDNKYRPLFFYYDGPDARKTQSTNGSGNPDLKPENAQPVILNLNADFKGVLWMPDIPVVINGNGHKFEGFIVAKEYRYLDTTQGLQVKYNSKIYVNSSTGDVYTKPVSKTTAMDIWGSNNVDTFNLSDDSKFRTFKAEAGVKFMYVFYGYDDNITMDETPFHEYCDLNKELIPMYDKNGRRVTKWADVKLYDENGKEIPKSLKGQGNKYKGSVRLDSNGNPSPIYDGAGNPIYFCEDYVRLTGTYEVLTLDRVTDGTRNPKEFLLTKTDALNTPDTDDWK